MKAKNMHREKVRCGLQRKAASCFKQILEAAPHKTAVLLPPSTYPTNYPSKKNKICWALPDK